MKREGWTFLSNHGHALVVCLASDPDVLLREVASQIGITERSAQQIVTDLEASGAIHRMKAGRRNTYVVHRRARFRHQLESGITIFEFIDLVDRARSRSDRVTTLHPTPRASSRSENDEGTLTA